MKILILSALISQVLLFPLYIFLTRRGFHYLTFPFFRTIAHALLFLVILITSHKSLALNIGLVFYGFLILDEIMDMRTLTRIEDFVASKLFKTKKTGWSFIPLGKISWFEGIRFDAEKDCGNLKFLVMSLYGRHPVLTYDNHDVLIKAGCADKTVLQFMSFGWYGPDLAKIVALGTLLYFI